ncbi:MAG: EAL domain-containing protein [Cyanobacteria bacterium P01_G01_bin.54]
MRLALVLGIGLSVSAAWGIERIERSRQREQFESKANSLGNFLQQSFDRAADATNALGGFFTVAEEITPEEFTQFSQRILKDSPGLLTVGFAKRVTESARLDFEADLQQNSAPYPFIWDGAHRRAAPAEEYIVTTYIEPFDQHQALLGYNHASDWQRYSVIERASQADMMMTTNTVQLPPPTYPVDTGFVVYQPLYQGDHPDSQTFTGVAYSTFQVEDAINTVIQDLDWQAVSFYIYDLDLDRLDSALVKGLDSLEQRLVVAYDGKTQAMVAANALAKPHNHPRHCPYSREWTVCLQTLTLQGREWSVLILPPARAYLPGSVWMTLTIGLLLTLTLTLYLGMANRQARHTEELVQALKEARSDPLTGLANRREFEHRLQQTLTHPQRNCHTLCYMDLDRFKIVNDVCGHEAGDRLLCNVGQLIQRRIRKGDLLARVGGDEFCLLLYHCSTTEAEAVVTDLLAAIAAFQFHWQEKTFNIGISIGLTGVTADVEDESELMRQADKACYQAKQNGRNCMVKFEREQQSDASHGLEWLTWLNEGLADEFLQLYCQPTLALKPEAARNYVEILLRLRDRPEVSLSLRDFIQDAERYQLMPTIDRWVFQTFLRYLAFFIQDTNLATDWETNVYAINLSGSTLSDDQFVSFCIAQLKQHQIPPQIICFEITESMAIANISKAKKLIKELRKLGCSFALDDFGSGMSSFAYLRDLPIDYLKVDGSFIVDLDGDNTTYNIVNAITRVGQVLGVQTVAEFVEDDGLLGKLRQLGFDYAQGYGVARPINFEQHLSSYSEIHK